jgi:non-lysosomal glucosylceramidase
LRIEFVFVEKAIATAVCANTLVKAGSKGVLEFSLVWDMPKIHFHNKNTNYSRYFVFIFETREHFI